MGAGLPLPISCRISGFHKLLGPLSERGSVLGSPVLPKLANFRTGPPALQDPSCQDCGAKVSGFDLNKTRS